MFQLTSHTIVQFASLIIYTILISFILYSKQVRLKRLFSIFLMAAAGTSCDTMQGFDLITPLAANEPSPRNHAVSAEYHQIALATKRWKIVYYFEYDTGQLFDRRNDPAEQINLYDDPAYNDIRNELLIALLGWRGDLSDLQAMRAATSGGGRVANIAAEHTRTMNALGSEIRLNKKVARIEA